MRAALAFLGRLAFAVMALTAVTLGVVVWQLAALPLPGAYENPGRGANLFKNATGAVFASRGPARGGRVRRGDLPQHLVDAVLTMEDRRFYQHGGVDLQGILRAAAANLDAGTVRQGGSTITQQLVKNQFLTPERTLTRKLQEAILALWLEQRLTKDEILERYLDSIYFGAGAYGIDAAAARYFGKATRDLSVAESAMLVGLIHAPSRLAPTRAPEAARARAETVLAAMVDAGAVSPAAAADARAHPAVLALPPDDTPGNGHFADWVDGEVMRLLGGVAADFTVETTLVPRLQAEAERIIARRLADPDQARGAREAALVALAPDGAVVAMVGGRDYDRNQFNRATQAHRQPGSLFKLCVYLAALEAGMTPDSLVLDAPITLGTWQPKNFGDRYLGRTTLRDAFAHSLNSVAVRLSEQVGRERVIAVARSLGIESPLGMEPSLALGTSEVTLLEITAAYAAVNAGVARIEPYAVRKIIGPGAMGYQRPPPGRPDPAAWSQAAMLDLLGAVVRNGTGTAAKLAVPSYGKTGTTQENRDAWFVGFTRELVVGVWVGNDDNTPMDGMTGGKLPAALWAEFVAAALPAITVPAVPEPVLSLAEPAPTPVPAPAPEGPQESSVPDPNPDPDPEPAPDLPQVIRPAEVVPRHRPVAGVPAVLDTGTLIIGGRTIRLEGVRGIAGSYAQDMARYIAGRPVSCAPSGSAAYRCTVDGWDLAEAVLFNGGGRTLPDAGPVLRAAEAKARSQRRGVWGGR